MSVRRKSIEYAAAALIISMTIIGASLYIGIPAPSFLSTTSGAQGGQSASLAIRLTDPPEVPTGTSSLNLTYSSLSLLVGEPTGSAGQFDAKSVTVTPSGGSATLDLLRLQNVSQTIATASLPSGSVLYSVTFAVSGIKIDVNGKVSSVSLATGGSSFTVTMANPRGFTSGDFALLQLSPVVVYNGSSYQLIPSSVGVMRNGGGGDENVGDKHQLTSEDFQGIRHARGNITASITALSVSGNVTTVTVSVSNIGQTPVELNGVGLHGNFTVVGNICISGENVLGGDNGMGYQPMVIAHPDSTTTTTSTILGAPQLCEIPIHIGQVVFIPVASSSSSTTTSTSTTSTSCTAGQMALVNGEEHVDHEGLTLNAGQCVQLTFVGQISFGHAPFDLIPSTSSGQVYILHIIASNGANDAFSCVLPLGVNSCNELPHPSFQH